MVASDAEMDSFEQQIQDAIEFLKKCQTELKELQNFGGAASLWLDFGVESRDVFVQCERFPQELLRLAGNLNIAVEISRYCG